MIKPHDIKKMVKHITKRDRGIPDKRLMHPTREWVISLVVCLLVLVGGGAWAYFGFAEYVEISLENQMLEDNTINYDRVDVSEAIELYQDHADRYNELVGVIPEPLPEPEPESEEASESNATTTPEVVNGNADVVEEGGVAEEENEQVGEVTEEVLEPIAEEVVGPALLD